MCCTINTLGCYIDYFLKVKIHLCILLLVTSNELDRNEGMITPMKKEILYMPLEVDAICFFF